ncbi:MAG: ATP-binding cassette domain-containing protein [Rhodospirillales bacterium]
MFELRGCSVFRGGRPCADGISVRLRPGTVLVMVGPNGAGKSTAMKLLSGEIAPDRGAALLDGEAISGVEPAMLAARRAVLAQSADHAFDITVRALAGLGLRMVAAPIGGGSARLVESALEQVGLENAGERMVRTLSGGERQRAHLARVLTQLAAGERRYGPGTLLLDEPLAAQDLAHQLAILRLARAHAAAGGAVCMVLHDLNCACAAADRIAVLRHGRLWAEGTPASVITAPILAEVFGIDTEPGALPGSAQPYVLPQMMRPHATPARTGTKERKAECILP